MGGVLAYSLRRTSARVLLAVALGGLVWAIYRVHPDRWPSMLGTGPARYFPPYRDPGSTASDLAAAALVVILALVVAAALWRDGQIRR